MFINIYIYIYREREREREFPTVAPNYWHCSTKRCGTLAPTGFYFL